MRLRSLAAVAVACLTTIPGSGAVSAAGSGAPSPRITVLSHNVMLLTPLAGDWANATRAGLIANADHVRGYDVVVLQEAFDNGPASTLMTGLSGEYPFQTPVLGRSRSGWDATSGAYSALTPEDGGVTVLSRWPITRKVQHVYKQGCGADWFSNKGFVYARLDVGGQRVHVVGTHLQADDSLCADPGAVRASQLGEIDTFLDGLQIPSSEQVIVAGDLNVDRASPEYVAMLATSDTVAPTAYAGHPFSADTTQNSIGAARYPDYPSTHLDYVLFRRGNQRPGSWTNTVLTPTSPPWTAGGAAYDDYSDHYPVAGG